MDRRAAQSDTVGGFTIGHHARDGGVDALYEALQRLGRPNRDQLDAVIVQDGLDLLSRAQLEPLANALGDDHLKLRGNGDGLHFDRP